MRTLQDACSQDKKDQCGENGVLQSDCECECNDGWTTPTAVASIASGKCTMPETDSAPGVLTTPPLQPPSPVNATEPPAPLIQPVITPAAPVEVSLPGVPGVPGTGFDTGIERSYLLMAALAVFIIGCFCWRRRVAMKSSRRNRKRRRSEWVPDGNGYCSDSDGSSNHGSHSRSRSPPPRRQPRSPRKRPKREKRYMRRNSTDSELSSLTASSEEHYEPEHRSPARQGKPGSSSKSVKSGRSGKSSRSGSRGGSSRSKSSHKSRWHTRN